MRKIISCLLVAVMLFLLVPFSSLTITANAAAPRYCIEATPSITTAVYKYLNDVYVNKYPSLGLEYTFGSAKDKNTLKNLATKITSGISTKEGKAAAIVDWVVANIEYCSYETGEAAYFAIDTYYTKKANCLGIAQLIVHLCRLSNIPAVMCGGSRGDMKNNLTLDTRQIDHAWVMLYYGNKWHLYDPLFHVYDSTDRSFISRWYFTDFIDGVSPYVKKYVSYINNGDAIFYINGRFVHYKNGIPASEYYKMAAEGGMSVNFSLPYYTQNRYDNRYDTGEDGFEYVTKPERKKSMINDECFSNGWLKYGGVALYYAKPNGILGGSTLQNYNGACYYLPFKSDAIKLPGASTDYTFTNGFPTLMKGKTLTLSPTWAASQEEMGRVIVWKSETPKTVKVTKNGVITGLSDGYACLSVCSKDTVNGKTHYMFSYVELWVSSKTRTVSYKTRIDASKLKFSLSKTSYNYDGNPKKPTVTVKNVKGRTLKAGTDYTVTYSEGRKNAGTYKVTVQMKGLYTGKKVLYFKINPVNVSKCTVKLAASSFEYNGKVRTPAVTVKTASGKVLKKGVDYTVTYSEGRKNIGTYKVTVKMKGNYTGTKNLSFKINPAGTNISKLTPGANSITVAWKTKSTVTGYQIQYSTRSDFGDGLTATVGNNTTKSGTISSLKKGKKYYVRVRVYKTVNGVKHYSAWSAAKYATVK